MVRIRRQSTVLAAVILCIYMTGAAGAGSLPPQIATKPQVPQADARVDINHATLSELLKVPGMTLPWAERIIRFRPYRMKNDLVDRGVVTGQVYDRIKGYVIAHRNAQ